MPTTTLRGRRRLLDAKRKRELCDLIARSATVEQAAETFGVSLRTVQRERCEDDAFDRDIRASLGAAPDPRKLMESAARTHWRAAAWLLERSDPEHYARRPASSASPLQLEAALTFVLEAALQAVPAEQRDALYAHMHAACAETFRCLFPNYGQWGDAKLPTLPPTPLADHQRWRLAVNGPHSLHVPDRPAAAESVDSPPKTVDSRPPVDAAPAEPRPGGDGDLSPKIAFATEFAPGDEDNPLAIARRRPPKRVPRFCWRPAPAQCASASPSTSSRTITHLNAGVLLDGSSSRLTSTFASG